MKVLGTCVVATCMLWSSYASIENMWSQWSINFVWFFVCLWILFDGVILALDLKAAERRADDFGAQLTRSNEYFQAQGVASAHLEKKINESHLLLMEIKTRLLMATQQTKSSQHPNTWRSKSESSSPNFSSTCGNIFKPPSMASSSPRRNSESSCSCSLEGKLDLQTYSQLCQPCKCIIHDEICICEPPRKTIRRSNSTSDCP